MPASLSRKEIIMNQKLQISIIWTVYDVQEVRPDLSNEQALEVLRIAEQKYDPNIGLNLSLLQQYADAAFPNISSNR